MELLVGAAVRRPVGVKQLLCPKASERAAARGTVRRGSGAERDPEVELR